MSSIGIFKNKKVLIAFGLVFLLIVGFFAYKLLIEGVEVETPTAQRRTTERSISRGKPQSQTKTQTKKESSKNTSPALAKIDTTQKLPGETPLYRLLKGWRDPFGNGNRRVAELEERIKVIKMEIELLKNSLEQEKLKEELAKLKKSRFSEPDFSSKSVTSSTESGPKKITVKAILISENSKTALLYFKSKKAWVRTGELFEGWTVSEIDSDKVILTKDGKNQILSYHPLPVYERGKNE